jgi:catechol 2,3-dioxygenase-like lactoylglutathione lyase family enzyme
LRLYARNEQEDDHMVHGVAVIWFPVTDLDRSVEFYAETLGLDRLNQEDDWAELEANGLRVGLNARSEESPGGEGGGVLAFQPDDELEDVVAELEDKGVEFDGGVSEHPWGRVAAFHDPDGNALQLYEPPAG